MIFSDIPGGSTVFIDANTLVYHFGADSHFGPACGELLKRVELHELRGVTSTHVLSEVAHRVMTIEAIEVNRWPIAGIAARLRRRPSEVQRLMVFKNAVEAILASQIDIATIIPSLILAAAKISLATGLLSNDALIVAVMQANGISNLASNDADFDRVAGISRFSPL